MPDRLLDRQVSLLEHLTSGAAIFGDAARRIDRPRPPGHRCRAASSRGAFLPREAHGEDRMGAAEDARSAWAAARAAIIRDFVEACPPVSISWLENARQFHDFLSHALASTRRPSRPTCPTSRLASSPMPASTAATKPAAHRNGAAEPPARIRRHPAMPFCVRCRHDVRSILEGRWRRCAGRAARYPARRRRCRPAPTHPIMSELSPDLFELARDARRFRRSEDLLRPAGRGRAHRRSRRRGLVEVRP